MFLTALLSLDERPSRNSVTKPTCRCTCTYVYTSITTVPDIFDHEHKEEDEFS